MIKFVATDLDGTLLDARGTLPQAVFPLAERLSERGILFAPASGRQYANLEKLFFPVRDRLLFICENGALVRGRGETLFLDPLPPETAGAAIGAVRREEGLFPILCCAENAYIEDDCEPFFTRAREPYTNCFKVDSLDDVLGKEPICKISVFDPAGARDHAMRVLSDLPAGVKRILSGTHWCDISAADADKGKAVRAICEKFGFTRDECIAFGDQMNDEGMLRACGHPRAVANALPAIRALAEKIVPPNVEGGVLSELEILLSEPGGQTGKQGIK